VGDPWLLTHFEAEDAQILADFLVDVIGLEAEVKALVTEFYARPERREEFYRQFLEGWNLGRALPLLNPILVEFGMTAERESLRLINEIRKLVAHQAPEGYTDDEAGWAMTFWRTRDDDLVLASYIEDRRTDAQRLTDVVRRLRRQLSEAGSSPAGES
jgi:hypothetical protein